MGESFSLGGDVLRQIVLDPLLPEPIVPALERRRLGEAMRRYDRLGRACWAGRLGSGNRAPERTPADLRGFETARGLAPEATGVVDE